MDIIDNQLFTVNDCEEFRTFFNVLPGEHSSTASHDELENASSMVICHSAENEKLLAISACNNPESKTSSSSQFAKTKTEISVKWKDENAIKLLIKLWQDHESLFKSTPIRNAAVWGIISENLQKMNPDWRFNALQCENKFKDLRRHYTATKDHNAQTGVYPKTCKFYDEMDYILGMKPTTKPVAIDSHLKRRASVLQSNNSTVQVTDTYSETSQSSSYENREKVCDDTDSQKKKKSTKMESQLETWALSNRAEAQKREEAREKRHRENMEKKERAIEAYESFMSKLLDKL